ncbi:MAG: hypothetical protein IJP62_07530 [Treponema sp.]|nr:hypothetical protein [Treponema sp.]
MNAENALLSEEDPMQFTFDMPADDVEVTTTFFDAIYVSASGNSGNDGLSEATAVDSLASAIRKINDIGNELSLENFDWTIKVCGTVTGAQTVVYPMLSGTASVTIVGVNDGIIDGNEAGTALTINLTVPVTIKNLTIQNGKTSSNNGAGILITGAPVNLTLDSCVVKNNSVENGSGAEICVEYNGGRTAGTKLTLNNTEVSSNTITHDDFVFTYSGAGIMIENSAVELTLKGASVIKDNIIDCSGRSGAGMGSETPNGAGLFLGNRATTTIEESVSIENNSFRLTSGGVSYGGGIYISGGTLTVPVSVFTNNVAVYGNKIYISPQSSSVVYNGESISIDRPVN